MDYQQLMFWVLVPACLYYTIKVLFDELPKSVIFISKLFQRGAGKPKGIPASAYQGRKKYFWDYWTKNPEDYYCLDKDLNNADAYRMRLDIIEMQGFDPKSIDDEDMWSSFDFLILAKHHVNLMKDSRITLVILLLISNYLAKEQGWFTSGVFWVGLVFILLISIIFVHQIYRAKKYVREAQEIIDTYKIKNNKED